MIRFGKEGKLTPRYVGPYEIFQRVGKVACDLKIPSELNSIHPILHVYIIRKCIGVTDSILLVEGFDVKVELSYDEVVVQILDPQVKRLRNKEVAFTKVFWRNHLVDRATWEAEADI